MNPPERMPERRASPGPFHVKQTRSVTYTKPVPREAAVEKVGARHVRSGSVSGSIHNLCVETVDEAAVLRFT
jgi:hypothetical protein